jgi:hypothetical protein
LHAWMTRLVDCVPHAGLANLEQVAVNVRRHKRPLFHHYMASVYSALQVGRPKLEL